MISNHLTEAAEGRAKAESCTADTERAPAYAGVVTVPITLQQRPITLRELIAEHAQRGQQLERVRLVMQGMLRLAAQYKQNPDVATTYKECAAAVWQALSP